MSSLRTDLDNNGTILDYASPRKRLHLRLPARSTLYCHVYADKIVLIETLVGKDGVIPALVIAVVMQAISLVFIVASTNGIWQLINSPGVIPLALMVLQIPLMLAIVHQTWRKTCLTVLYHQVLLSFTSPLHRKHYQWTGDEIADVLLIETANTQTEMSLAELLITRAGGGDIHLFTDHRTEEIKRLVTILPPMLREGLPPITGTGPLVLTSVMAVPIVQAQVIDVTATAMQTSGRLVDLHRDLRNKPQ